VKPCLKFATASCDKTLKIFTLNHQSKHFEETARLDNVHTEWVRDCNWSPSLFNPCDLLVSAGEVDFNQKGWESCALENKQRRRR